MSYTWKLSKKSSVHEHLCRGWKQNYLWQRQPYVHQNGFPKGPSQMTAFSRKKKKFNCMEQECFPQALFPSLPADGREPRGPGRLYIMQIKAAISLNHHVENCLLNTHIRSEDHKFCL